jgi:hypothetical protein
MTAIEKFNEMTDEQREAVAKERDRIIYDEYINNDIAVNASIIKRCFERAVLFVLSNKKILNLKKIEKMKNIFVFDCESTSLHGTTFAVGCVVYSLLDIPYKREYGLSFGKKKETRVEKIENNVYQYNNMNGREIGAYICEYFIKKEWVEIDRFELLSLEGKEKAGDWVKENVIPNISDMPTCDTDKELRDRFFEFYMKHKENSDVYSDVNYPVETNFLAAVVADDLKSREWVMPYPLFDIAMYVDIEIDRCEKYENETGKKLRKHNPVDDSIASFHCFINSNFKL